MLLFFVTSDKSKCTKSTENPFSFKKFIEVKIPPVVAAQPIELNDDGSLMILDLANDLPDFVQVNFASPRIHATNDDSIIHLSATRYDLGGRTVQTGRSDDGINVAYSLGNVITRLDNEYNLDDDSSPLSYPCSVPMQTNPIGGIPDFLSDSSLVHETIISTVRTPMCRTTMHSATSDQMAHDEYKDRKSVV